MPSPAHIAFRRRLPGILGAGLTLLGAFGLIAWCCRTPELGSRLYDRGRFAAALPLLEAAAAAGSVPSSVRLARLLEQGTIVPADPWRALALYRHAAGRASLTGMASSRADWTLDGARLISSAKRMLAKIGPRRTVKRPSAA